MTNGLLLSDRRVGESFFFLFPNDSQLPQGSITFAEAKTWTHTVKIRARKLYYREKQITTFILLALFVESEYVKKCLKSFFFNFHFCGLEYTIWEDPFLLDEYLYRGRELSPNFSLLYPQHIEEPDP